MTSAPSSSLDGGTGLSSANPDRRFRPDVEGLRAIAVITVVLYHAQIPGIRGGYIGVDVFFVISGYVITRLLLGQVGRHGRPHFAEFYARRARRILPAAALVAVVAVLLSYDYLGPLRGNGIANDSRWVAVFLGNVHFSNVGTNYFQSELPPSTLQNYWSLAVEEQFYVVYPLLIFGLGFLLPRLNIRTKLFALTALIFAGSYVWSAYYTAHNPSAAYFALSTRAWELALGGLLAAGALHRINKQLGAVLGWVGLLLIILATLLFTKYTPYPGWQSIMPVGGAALVILCGATNPQWGPEILLKIPPLQWIGKLSFSIYLWHWPIIMVAEEDATKALPILDRLGLIAISVVAAALTYYLFENRIRTSRRLSGSTAWSLTMGAAIVVVLLVFGTAEIHSHHLI